MLLYVDQDGSLVWELTERIKFVFPVIDNNSLKSIVELRDALQGKLMQKRFEFTSAHIPRTVLRIGKKEMVPVELILQITRRGLRLLVPDENPRMVWRELSELLPAIQNMLDEFVGTGGNRSSSSALRRWTHANEHLLADARKILRNV